MPIYTQHSVPVRLRRRQPAGTARRQPGRLLPHDVHGAGGLVGPPRLPALRRRRLGVLRLDQRHARRLQRGQPDAGRVRRHRLRHAWLEHAGRRGLPLERRVVPRRPGHVSAERDLPRRLPVEPGARRTSATSRAAALSTCSTRTGRSTRPSRCATSEPRAPEPASRSSCSTRPGSRWALRSRRGSTCRPAGSWPRSSWCPCGRRSSGLPTRPISTRRC